MYLITFVNESECVMKLYIAEKSNLAKCAVNTYILAQTAKKRQKFGAKKIMQRFYQYLFEPFLAYHRYNVHMFQLPFL
jgi:DNA topoisomerase IA